MSLSNRRLCSFVSALLAAAGVWYSDHSVTQASSGKTRNNPITAGTNSSQAPRYQVIEVTIGHQSIVYSNVWEGPNVSVTFSSPSGRNFVVGAFFYTENTWKARFAPAELGNWTWTVSWNDNEGTQTAQGTFTCVGSAERGWVRRHPTNPFRLVYEDGTLFPGIGIIDCVNDWDGSGSPFDDDFGLDGGPRPNHSGGGTTTSLENYLTAYQQAGFNLFRWSVDNCSFKLWNVISPGGNTYLETQGKWGDQFLASLRQHGFRVQLGVFGFSPAFPNDSADTEKMNAVKRYIKYVVDRYGAWVDVWDLMNEASVDDQWYLTVAGYLRSVDPYAHAITTNFPRPDIHQIEINSPHWYQSENELQSDSAMVDQIALDKFTPNAQQEPLVYGEQGNNFQNWDPGSALRMRIRSWTAFFSEATLIFWNTSGMTDYTSVGSANIYLGPVERGYIRGLQNFTGGVASDIVKFSPQVADSASIRSYGLQGAHAIYGYFHHFTSHATSVSSTVSVDVPWSNASVKWVDPATGTAIQTQNISGGHASLAMPAFNVDLALAITEAANLGTITATPNPIVVCDGGGHGATVVSWTATQATTVEVHIGSPTGMMFARGGAVGSQPTGSWVAEGMMFYLQDVTNGPASAANTIASVTAHLTTTGCTVNPTGTVAANPNPITACDGTKFAQTVITWSSSSVSTVEVHINSPSGPMFARGGGSGSQATGKWVADGTVFYLQNVSGGLPLTPNNTLASTTVSFACTSTAPIMATPNPILTCGSSSGSTTISWTASGVSTVDIMVGPARALFASGGATGSKATGAWVNNGLEFVLMNHDTGAQLGSTTVGVAGACP